MYKTTYIVMWDKKLLPIENSHSYDKNSYDYQY